MLRKELEEWVEAVMDVYDGGFAGDTYKMMLDIDRIIAEAFDREPIMEENK